MRTFDYVEVRRAAEAAVRRAVDEMERGDADCLDGNLVQLSDVARMVARRNFGAFRARVAAQTNLEKFVVETFITSRIRRFVLAYLSVQEGSAFEGPGADETPIPALIVEFLYGAGRKPVLRALRRRGMIRFDLRFDPVADLRRIYLLTLREGRARQLTRWQRAYIRACRFRYRAKLRLLHEAGRFFVSILSHKTPDPIARLFRLDAFLVVLKALLPIIFEDAALFNEDEWNDLRSRILGYFPERISTLFRVIPRYSLESNGLIKLFKVAVGVIAGRIAARHEHEAGDVDFVFNTLRAAYCWGLTYPLVDNVLDSDELTVESRLWMTSSILALFSDQGPPIYGGETGPPETLPHAVMEALERLSETLELVPAARLDRAKAALRQLYGAHQRDSDRRLETSIESDPAVAMSVLIDTALKSALVRLSTMEICGIDTDSSTLTESLHRGLFNQLGDDLWDIYEDYADRRVTPFTLFLTSPMNSFDPFLFYLSLTRSLARSNNRLRATAAFLGFCETLRDSLDCHAHRNDHPHDVERNITRVLLEGAGLGPCELPVRVVPHVDFDALLFLAEASMFDVVGALSRSEPRMGWPSRFSMGLENNP
jgi:hypothetical protein